jgi:hypothetical protein
MSWQREGQQVKGFYLGLHQVTGCVTESRVAYGGRVKHTIRLDQTIQVYGADRDTVILDEDEVKVED